MFDCFTSSSSDYINDRVNKIRLQFVFKICLYVYMCIFSNKYGGSKIKYSYR